MAGSSTELLLARARLYAGTAVGSSRGLDGNCEGCLRSSRRDRPRAAATPSERRSRGARLPPPRDGALVRPGPARGHRLQVVVSGFSARTRTSVRSRPLSRRGPRPIASTRKATRSGSTTSPTSATASRPPTRSPTSCRGRAPVAATTAPGIPSAAGSSSWAATRSIRPPSATEYENRLIGPYRAALPFVDEPRGTHLYAIPGNHDWYDGLTNFIRIFCQKAWIGGWQTRQERSYFALELPHRWWLWAIDIQFDAYIDDPQLAYFRAANELLRQGDQVILADRQAELDDSEAAARAVLRESRVLRERDARRQEA